MVRKLSGLIFEIHNTMNLTSKWHSREEKINDITRALYVDIRKTHLNVTWYIMGDENRDI